MLEINPVSAAGVGNASAGSFTYIKGTYSSYTQAAVLTSTSNGQQTGIIKAYDDGINLYIWVYTWAKPYLGYGEKVASTPSLGVAGMGSDGLSINLNGIIPTTLGGGQYNWKVDSSAVKDPEIDSPSYDISAVSGALAPGGILSGPDVFIATIPIDSQTTFNVALFMHHSPPKTPLPNPSEITTQLYIDTNTPTNLINLGQSVIDTATATSTSSSTSNPVTYAAQAGGAHGTGGNLKVHYPTTTAGDLVLLQIMIRDTSTAPTLPIGSGFTLLFGPDSSGTGRQWVYYKFATGPSSGDLTITFAGTALKLARMYTFRNVATSSFIESSSFGFDAGSKTILAQPVTTSGAGRLAVSLIFDTSDGSLAAFTGESGGDWKEPTGEFHSGDGLKGGLQLQVATMASAGMISGGSAAAGKSASWGERAFALIPLGSVPIYPTGTVDFQVLPPSGTWVTYDTETLSSGSATSTSYTPLVVGDYFFRAVYSGDANNLPSTSGDNDEPLTVVSLANIVTTLSVEPVPWYCPIYDTAVVTPSDLTGYVWWEVDIAQPQIAYDSGFQTCVYLGTNTRIEVPLVNGVAMMTWPRLVGPDFYGPATYTFIAHFVPSDPTMPELVADPEVVNIPAWHY